MNSARVIIALLLAGWLPLLHGAEAQPGATSTDTQQPQQTDQQSVEQAQQAGTAPQPETDADQADGEPTEEERSTTSRFIPTEQVSQDLGVSFPADI